MTPCKYFFQSDWIVGLFLFCLRITLFMILRRNSFEITHVIRSLLRVNLPFSTTELSFKLDD